MAQAVRDTESRMAAERTWQDPRSGSRLGARPGQSDSASPPRPASAIYQNFMSQWHLGPTQHERNAAGPPHAASSSLEMGSSSAGRALCGNATAGTNPRESTSPFVEPPHGDSGAARAAIDPVRPLAQPGPSRSASANAGARLRGSPYQQQQQHPQPRAQNQNKRHG